VLGVPLSELAVSGSADIVWLSDVAGVAPIAAMSAAVLTILETFIRTLL
jgi:hypothetical protein